MLIGLACCCWRHLADIWAGAEVTGMLGTANHVSSRACSTICMWPDWMFVNATGDEWGGRGVRRGRVVWRPAFTSRVLYRLGGVIAEKRLCCRFWVKLYSCPRFGSCFYKEEIARCNSSVICNSLFRQALFQCCLILGPPPEASEYVLALSQLRLELRENNADQVVELG